MISNRTPSRAQAPALMEAPGVSTGTIADMLVVLGDNPQRIRPEAAFASMPRSGLERQDQPPSPQPRRQSTGERRPVSHPRTSRAEHGG